MTNLKTEALSIRVPTEAKEKFLELYDQSTVGSKSKFFQKLMDKYNEKSKEPIIEDIEQLPLPHEEKIEDNVIEDLTEVNEPILEDIEDPVIENLSEEKSEIESEDIEVTLKLTPVQAFALRETILNEGFAQEVNRVVFKVDNAKDTSFFGNSLYSGDYKGIFSPMDLDNENVESINENMGIALINHFISSIVFGAHDLFTPITQNMLKDFLQEKPANE